MVVDLLSRTQSRGPDCPPENGVVTRLLSINRCGQEEDSLHQDTSGL
jgi:hypothetical protein